MAEKINDIVSKKKTVITAKVNSIKSDKVNNPRREGDSVGGFLFGLKTLMRALKWKRQGLREYLFVCANNN